MSKKYDAEKVRSYCDGMSDAFTTYGTAIDSAQLACVEYSNNDTFIGEQADAAKALVGDGEISVMNEILSINEKIKTAQDTIMEMFSSQVDAADDALIDEETLEQINTDITSFYEEHDSIGTQVEGIFDRLQKFSKYGVEFTEPDFDSGRDAFKALCGGDGEDGFIKECIQKLIDFDTEALAMLEGLGLEEEIEKLVLRLTNASSVMQQFRVYNALLSKNIVLSAQMQRHGVLPRFSQPLYFNGAINTLAFWRGDANEYSSLDWILRANNGLSLVRFEYPKNGIDRDVVSRIDHLLEYDIDGKLNLETTINALGTDNISKEDVIALKELIIAATNECSCPTNTDNAKEAERILEIIGDSFIEDKPEQTEGFAGNVLSVKYSVKREKMNVLTDELKNEERGADAVSFLERVSAIDGQIAYVPSYYNNVDYVRPQIVNIISSTNGEYYDEIRFDLDQNSEITDKDKVIVLPYTNRVRRHVNSNEQNNKYAHMNSIGYSSENIEGLLLSSYTKNDVLFYEDFTTVQTIVKDDVVVGDYSGVFAKHNPEELSESCGMAVASFMAYLQCANDKNGLTYDDEYFSISNAMVSGTKDSIEKYLKFISNGTNNYSKVVNAGAIIALSNLEMTEDEYEFDEGLADLINISNKQSSFWADCYAQYRVIESSVWNSDIAEVTFYPCVPEDKLSASLISGGEMHARMRVSIENSNAMYYSYEEGYGVAEFDGVINTAVLAGIDGGVEKTHQELIKIQEERRKSEEQLGVETAVSLLKSFTPGISGTLVEAGLSILTSPKSTEITRSVVKVGSKGYYDVIEKKHMKEDKPLFISPLVDSVGTLCDFCIKSNKINNDFQAAVESKLGDIALLLGYSYISGTGEVLLADPRTMYEYERWNRYGCRVLYSDARITPLSEETINAIFEDLTNDDGTGISQEAHHTNYEMYGTHRHGIFGQSQADNYRGCGVDGCEHGYSDAQKVAALKLVLYGETGLSNEEKKIYGHITDMPTDLLVTTVSVIDNQMNEYDHSSNIKNALLVASGLSEEKR